MSETLLTPKQDRARRLAWFREARFGMFIHWGLYAQLGRHEWAMNYEQIPIEEYEKLADTWNPKPNAARQWAKTAKQAGMRYMVMTTKHHEGYFLWDTKMTDYNSVKRSPGRDLVAEYVEAARAEGLKVGFYYSLMDWHHPDGAMCKVNEAARRRFIDFTHGAVKELCSNYGKLDILWYDVNWPLDAEEWESDKLCRMAKALQPDIIINDRSGIPEDFGTPEGHITAAESGRAWEACMTFNDSWGYTPIDVNYKNAWQVHQMLRQVAIGHGNLLLNIGPTPEGDVPPECEKILGEVGDWMKRNGKSIYDATDPLEDHWNVMGLFTLKGQTAYYHCHRWPGKELALGGITSKVLSVKYLKDGVPVKFTQTDRRLILHGLPEKAPDFPATVFEIEVEGKFERLMGCWHKNYE
ncbi:MAG: alpha-L-fucosidase [bacterium]